MRQNLPPDWVPMLSRGRHRRPTKGACFMELASFLAGERWSDHPACTHALLATLARTVNDQMSDGGRQRLLPLVPSVIGLTSEDREVDVRLALWCATSALPVVAEETQRVLAVGILAAERRLAEIEGRTDGVLTERSARALADVPLAAEWARRFSLGLTTSAAGFHETGAPSIVCCSVLGVADACVPDTEDRMLAMLAAGIEIVRVGAAREERRARAAEAGKPLPQAPAVASARERVGAGT
ncbi:hypothetical protein [Cellulomonas sp. NS3]|uniref:hypothetical protein n=1 Tax=Cellulomonas sp. NS3 TaxID=2973977 RepID=UPI002162CC0A|nr:hypothetical protein [Cellulomonas sp. NS3]